VTSVTWADKELKHHVQVEVQPGQSVDVEICLPASACSLVNASAERIVEPGEFELLVGPNSRSADCLSQRFWIA
jgi:beta-glucosidase